MARHTLALEHTARRLTLTNGTGGAMGHRDTVGSRHTSEVVTLDGTGETLADGRARDVDHLADDEQVHLELAARLQAFTLGYAETEFHAGLARRRTGLGEVALLGLRDTGGTASAPGDLDGAVTVRLAGLNLRNAVGERLNHGDGNRFTRRREDSGHAALAAYQTETHLPVPR